LEAPGHFLVTWVCPPGVRLLVVDHAADPALPLCAPVPVPERSDDVPSRWNGAPGDAYAFIDAFTVPYRAVATCCGRLRRRAGRCVLTFISSSSYFHSLIPLTPPYLPSPRSNPSAIPRWCQSAGFGGDVAP
jgi:hypothetical protein